MDTILNIVLVFILLIIAYQDIKMRLIHFILPIFVLVIGIYMNWKFVNYIEISKSFLFLLLNFILITLYFSLKNKQLLNPFKELIGWGDVLFLIAVLPLFSFRNYLLFFIMGMIFSLLLFAIFKSIYRMEKTIPLAGYLSVFIIGLIGISLIIDHNIFYGFII